MLSDITRKIKSLFVKGVNNICEMVNDKKPQNRAQKQIVQIDNQSGDFTLTLGRLRAKQYNLNCKYQLISQDHKRLTQQIESLVSSSQDDLARLAIAKQFELDEQLLMIQTEQYSLNVEKIEVLRLQQVLEYKKKQNDEKNTKEKTINAQSAADENKLSELDQLIFDDKVQTRLNQIKNSKEML
jgi:phage shock protein A